MGWSRSTNPGASPWHDPKIPSSSASGGNASCGIPPAACRSPSSARASGVTLFLVLLLEAAARRWTKPRTRNPPLFVPLRLEDQPEPTAPSIAPGVELELPHQVRLRFDSPPEPEWLGRVVAAIAGLAAGEATP